MRRSKFKKCMFNARMGIPLFLLFIMLLTACGNNTYTGGTSNLPEGTKIANPPSTQTSVPGSPTLAVPTSSTTSLQAASVPFKIIRMVDKAHGWALEQHAVLKTDDGGLHWRDVSPSPNPLLAYTGQVPLPSAFRDDDHAWIAIPPFSSSNVVNDTIVIIRTTDGGTRWSTSTVTEPGVAGAYPPHFINVHEGWLEVNLGVAAGSESVDIFHTTDGGANWTKIASTGTDYSSPSGLPFGGEKTGLSFRDAQTGWATYNTYAPDRLFLYVTHDGGHTWQYQALPTVAGMSNVMYETTPPVLFGRDGILPVRIATGNGNDTYYYYVTHNGGQSWTPDTSTNSDFSDSYVVDPQHAWAYNGASLYATSDAGDHWSLVATLPQIIGELSFVDTNNGWAIGPLDGSRGFLFHTTDGGHTWQQISYSVTPH